MKPAAYPTPEQIDVALVEAARLLRELPQAIRNGLPSQARHVALAALREVFPEATGTRLAEALGYGHRARNGTSLVRNARLKEHWWRETDVETVVGALKNEHHGEQAK